MVKPEVGQKIYVPDTDDYDGGLATISSLEVSNNVLYFTVKEHIGRSMAFSYIFDRQVQLKERFKGRVANSGDEKSVYKAALESIAEEYSTSPQAGIARVALARFEK